MFANDLWPKTLSFAVIQETIEMHLHKNGIFDFGTSCLCIHHWYDHRDQVSRSIRQHRCFLSVLSNALIWKEETDDLDYRRKRATAY